MRVTHIITRFSRRRRSGKHGRHRSSAAAQSDLRVDLISGPTPAPKAPWNPVLTPLPGSSPSSLPGRRPVHPFLDWRATDHLTSLLRERHLDIVHTHSGKAGIWTPSPRIALVSCNHSSHPGLHSDHFQGALSNFAFRAAEKFAARYTNLSFAPLMP